MAGLEGAVSDEIGGHVMEGFIDPVVDLNFVAVNLGNH